MYIQIDVIKISYQEFNNHTNTFIIYRMQINIFKAIYIIYNFNIL